MTDPNAAVVTPDLAAKSGPHAETCATMAHARLAMEPGDWRTAP